LEHENPKIPEGINVTNEHPLKGFFYLLVTVGVFAIGIIIIVSLTVGVLVKWVPFETESKLADNVIAKIKEVDSGKEKGDRERNAKVTHYLQKLANQLSDAQQLPQEMKITVHYIDEPVINAFATLGGHIVIYQGVIDSVKSENALAMVVAHEIAHVKHRHPIVAMGRGTSIGLILAAITGFGDSGFSSQMVGQMGSLSSLAFSRGQETESDEEAFTTLLNYYGHVEGATDLFRTLSEYDADQITPEWLSSHPLSQKRVIALENLQAGLPNQCSNQKQCEITPLPSFLRKN
jgi:predicted Zn-dependent protease